MRYFSLTVFILTLLNAQIFPILYLVCLSCVCVFWTASSFVLLWYLLLSSEPQRFKAPYSTKGRSLHCKKKKRRFSAMWLVTKRTCYSHFISASHCTLQFFSILFFLYMLTQQTGIITVEVCHQRQNTHLKKRHLYSDTLLCRASWPLKDLLTSIQCHRRVRGCYHSVWFLNPFPQTLKINHPHKYKQKSDTQTQKINKQKNLLKL